MRFITCNHANHASAILAIFNEAIENSTALYDYKPRTQESMVGWFYAKKSGNFPVIGVEDDAGTLMGFASYGPFRAFPAYKYSIEHSVYVHKDHRGKGLGRLLLERLIGVATAENYHTMIGGIDASNAASIALHKQMGFTPCSIIEQAGFKFGRWLDLAFYQKILPTPATPVDG